MIQEERYQVVGFRKDWLISCPRRSIQFIHLRASFSNCHLSNVYPTKETTYVISSHRKNSRLRAVNLQRAAQNWRARATFRGHAGNRRNVWLEYTARGHRTGHRIPLSYPSWDLARSCLLPRRVWKKFRATSWAIIIKTRAEVNDRRSLTRQGKGEKGRKREKRQGCRGRASCT